MHPIRLALKKQLLAQSGWKPICPLTGNPATDLHEICTWPGRHLGTKYGASIYDPEKWVELARVYFVPELCVLVSNDANINIADSRREELLQYNMERYGPERVIEALRKVAQHITCPNAYIPASIDFRGTTYLILDKEST